MAFRYVPKGAPWARIWITTLLLGIFKSTLLILLLATERIPDFTQGLLVGLIGTLGTSITICINWWFKIEENGNGEGGEPPSEKPTGIEEINQVLRRKTS